MSPGVRTAGYTLPVDVVSSIRYTGYKLSVTLLAYVDMQPQVQDEKEPKLHSKSYAPLGQQIVEDTVAKYFVEQAGVKPFGQESAA